MSWIRIIFWLLILLLLCILSVFCFFKKKRKKSFSLNIKKRLWLVKRIKEVLDGHLKDMRRKHVRL